MDGSDIARQFFSSYYSLGLNLDGISDAESVVAPDRGGSSINWILGHIIQSRHRVFGLMGLSGVWSEDKVDIYGRGTVPDADRALSLVELRRVLDESQQPFLVRLKELTEEELDAPLAEPSKVLGKTLRTALIFMSFHEAYHCGQIGILRRMVGKEGAIP